MGWRTAPVTQAEIRDAFADGSTVRTIVPERYEITFEPGFALAWLATIDRTES